MAVLMKTMCEPALRPNAYWCCAEADDPFDAVIQDVDDCSEMISMNTIGVFDVRTDHHKWPCSSSPSVQRSSWNIHDFDCGASLEFSLFPGDVLCVRPGEPGALMQLGSGGGFMGHVLLVIESPRCIRRHTTSALAFIDMWPAPNVQVAWAVKTLESTRHEEGFHESEQLLYVHESGRIYVMGEEPVDSNRIYKLEAPGDEVQLWHCPPKLRANFSWDLMQEVLADMKNNEANWSWSTAVRAVLLSADVSHNEEKASILQACKNSWTVDPICTTVVIVFWQRYLCRLAERTNADEGGSTPEINPTAWIVDWMPLKGDRALPGELMATMERCGWTFVSHLGKDQA